MNDDEIMQEGKKVFDMLITFGVLGIVVFFLFIGVGDASTATECTVYYGYGKLNLPQCNMSVWESFFLGAKYVLGAIVGIVILFVFFHYLLYFLGAISLFIKKKWGIK